MEAINFTQAPEGTTHFLRFASGYIVWCCVVDGGPNGQPMVSEWDSFNNYWVPSIHTMEHNEAIGLTKIGDAVPAKFAPQLGEAPKGATHHYEHGGDVNWYRETERGLYRWEQGSWCASRHKDIKELMDKCPLGQLTLLWVEQEGPVEDDLTWLARYVRRWTALPGATHIAKDKRVGHVYGWFNDGVRPSAGRVWFTKDQYLARRAELQNKPSWKDAPAQATCMAQEPHGGWTFFACQPFRPSSVHNAEWWFEGFQAWDSHRRGEVLGDWRDTLEQRPVDAGQFDQPVVVAGTDDATWHERGALPPVGVVCEAATEGCKYERCEILAYHKGQVALRWFEFNDGCLDVLEFDGWSFRPISTDHQVLVDLARGNRADAGLDERDLADAILAAGFTRDGGAA